MFGERLKMLRKKAGIKTQAEMANLLGIQPRKYSSWERNEVELPLADAIRICKVLEITPNDLAGWEMSAEHKEAAAMMAEALSMINTATRILESDQEMTLQQL